MRIHIGRDHAGTWAITVDAVFRRLTHRARNKTFSVWCALARGGNDGLRLCTAQPDGIKK